MSGRNGGGPPKKACHDFSTERCPMSSSNWVSRNGGIWEAQEKRARPGCPSLAAPAHPSRAAREQRGPGQHLEPEWALGQGWELGASRPWEGPWGSSEEPRGAYAAGRSWAPPPNQSCPVDLSCLQDGSGGFHGAVESGTRKGTAGARHHSQRAGAAVGPKGACGREVLGQGHWPSPRSHHCHVQCS